MADIGMANLLLFTLSTFLILSTHSILPIVLIEV